MDIDTIKKLPRTTAGLLFADSVNGDGTPVSVDIYYDATNSRVYQVGDRNSLFREGDSSVASAYGPWHRF